MNFVPLNTVFHMERDPARRITMTNRDKRLIESLVIDGSRSHVYARLCIYTWNGHVQSPIRKKDTYAYMKARGRGPTYIFIETLASARPANTFLTFKLHLMAARQRVFSFSFGIWLATNRNDEVTIEVISFGTFD